MEHQNTDEQKNKGDDPADAVVEPFDLPDPDKAIAEDVDNGGDRIEHIQGVVLAAGGKSAHGLHIVGDGGSVHPQRDAEASQHGKITVLRGQGGNNDTHAESQHCKL